jgi:hypothetical protein
MPTAYGLCHLDTTTIDIREGQHPLEEADTVIHEIFHAILNRQGRGYAGKTEELYVRALATGLTTVISENPKFAAWLASIKS